MTQIKDRMRRARDYATYEQETAAHPLTESAAGKDWALVVQNFHYRYERFRKSSGEQYPALWTNREYLQTFPTPLQVSVMVLNGVNRIQGSLESKRPLVSGRSAAW